MPTMNISTNINKAMIKEFRKDCDQLMKTLGEKYKLDISLGNVTFDTTSFVAQLKAVDVSSGKEGGLIEWEKYAPMYGVPISAYGKEFTIGKVTVKIVGFNNRAKKRPIMAEEVGTGESYSLTINGLLSLLETNETK